MLTRMARTGCGSHGLCLLGSTSARARLSVLASLAPCAPSGCPLRSATAGPVPRPSWLADRGPAATSTPLALPPRARHGQGQGHLRMWPMPFGCTTGMRPQSPADRRIWSVPCRGALPRARICEPPGAPEAMRPVQEKTSVGEAQNRLFRAARLRRTRHRPATHRRRSGHLAAQAQRHFP